MTLELILKGCRATPTQDAADIYETIAAITNISGQTFRIEVDEHHYALYNYIISKYLPKVINQSKPENIEFKLTRKFSETSGHELKDVLSSLKSSNCVLEYFEVHFSPFNDFPAASEDGYFKRIEFMSEQIDVNIKRKSVSGNIYSIEFLEGVTFSYDIKSGSMSIRSGSEGISSLAKYMMYIMGDVRSRLDSLSIKMIGVYS